MDRLSKEIVYTLIVFPFFCVVSVFAGCQMKSALLQSPNGEIVIKAGTEEGFFFYTVFYKTEKILDGSRLGFMLSDGILGQNLNIKTINYSTTNEYWELVWNEKKKRINLYNQMVVSVEEEGETKRKFDIIFRAFNEGYAFRYEFPIQNHLTTFVVINECSEFKFMKYAETKDNSWFLSESDTISPPLTMEIKEGVSVTVCETDPANYASMHLTAVDGRTSLKTSLTPMSGEEKIVMKTPAVTPWRILFIKENTAVSFPEN